MGGGGWCAGAFRRRCSDSLLGPCGLSRNCWPSFEQSEARRIDIVHTAMPRRLRGYSGSGVGRRRPRGRRPGRCRYEGAGPVLCAKSRWRQPPAETRIVRWMYSFSYVLYLRVEEPESLGVDPIPPGIRNDLGLPLALRQLMERQADPHVGPVAQGAKAVRAHPRTGSRVVRGGHKPELPRQERVGPGSCACRTANRAAAACRRRPGRWSRLRHSARGLRWSQWVRSSGFLPLGAG
jgi:hypothetical protein